MIRETFERLARRGASLSALLVLVGTVGGGAVARADTPRCIALLSDYGLTSETVGLMHGVLQARAPGAAVIDLCQDVPIGDVQLGGFMLRRADRLPPNSIVVGLVDPNAGPESRYIAFRTTRGMICVGPNNGLFRQLMSQQGIFRAFFIDPMKVNPSFQPGVSEPWELLCPAAAMLATNGLNLVPLGPGADKNEVLIGDAPEAIASPARGEVAGVVLRVDPNGDRWTNVSALTLKMAGVKARELLALSVGEDGAESPLHVRYLGAEPRGGTLLEDVAARHETAAFLRGDLLVMAIPPGSGANAPQLSSPVRLARATP